MPIIFYVSRYRYCHRFRIKIKLTSLICLFFMFTTIFFLFKILVVPKAISHSCCSLYKFCSESNETESLEPFHSWKVHRTPQTLITPGTPHRLYVPLMRIFDSKVTISRYRYPRPLLITLEPFSRRNGFTVLQSRRRERDRDERSYTEEVANKKKWRTR